MKVTSMSMIHRGLIPFVVCCLLFVAILRCPAADDPFDSALPAAQAWLGLIDAGNYDGSYDTAGRGLYEKVPTKKQWVTALKIMRAPWGGVVNRSPIQHLYQPNGIIGLNGECMLIAFDTSTKKDSDTKEVVVLRFEDGKWRGVGYTMGAKSNAGVGAGGDRFP